MYFLHFLVPRSLSVPLPLQFLLFVYVWIFFLSSFFLNSSHFYVCVSLSEFYTTLQFYVLHTHRLC